MSEPVFYKPDRFSAQYSVLGNVPVGKGLPDVQVLFPDYKISRTNVPQPGWFAQQGGKKRRTKKSRKSRKMRKSRKSRK